MHTCKKGGYHYFTHLCLVAPVISNLVSVLEYWHKYPTLKLSSISHSRVLILAHIIKNNFNTVLIVYVPMLQVVPQINSYCTCIGDLRSTQVVFSLLFIYVMSSLDV